ncbi:hypothetical protein [Sphingobium yanoikuyae]|uniref:hypothetical protein n=1 Tax=Sphingobium yanoikuyae TaxID=13690 RepID=UPI0028AABCB4|nr:hypothetical protein [Sphingobium yanoikuyae]
MAIWMVRSGRDDAFLKWAIEYQVAIIGFKPLPDLADISNDKNGEAMLRQRLRAAHPDRADQTFIKWRNEIWAFLYRIKPGDRIIMPYNAGSRAWQGVWEEGDYIFRQDIRPGGVHTHPVKWENDVAKEALNEEMARFWKRRATVAKVD